MHVTSANDTFNTLKQIHTDNKSRDIRLVLDLSSDDAAEVILRLVKYHILFKCAHNLSIVFVQTYKFIWNTQF